MPRRECSIFACPALAGLLPAFLLPALSVPALSVLLASCAGVERTSGHEWDNATRFFDFGTAEEWACGPPSSRDGPAGRVPDVHGGSGFDPALGPARDAALDALHAREMQRLNDLIPDGGM